MLYDAIKKLVQYGINTGITPESERIYTTNLLLDLFHEDNYEDVDCDLNNLVLEDILAELLDSPQNAESLKTASATVIYLTQN